MKVCVALAEATTAAVAARMAELAPWADLFEVRADHVRDLDLGALLRARTRPILFTCRSDAEGGPLPGSRRERPAPIAAARPSSAASTSSTSRREPGFDDVVAAKAGRGLVLSWHDTEGTPDDLDAVYDRMAAAAPRRREDRGHRALGPRPRPAARARGPPRRGRGAAARRHRDGPARGRLADPRRPLRRAVRLRLRGLGTRHGPRPAHGAGPGRQLSRALHRPRHARLRPARQRRAAQPLAGDPEPGVRRARDRRRLRAAAGGVDGRLPGRASRARPVGLERDASLQGRHPGPPRLRDGTGGRGRLGEHRRRTGRPAGRPQHGRRRRARPAAEADRPGGTARRDPGRRGRRARGGLRARARRGACGRAGAPRRAGARGGGGDGQRRRGPRRARPRAVRRARERDPARLGRLPGRVARVPRARCDPAAWSSTWSTSRARRRCSPPRALGAARRSTASRCWSRRPSASSRPGLAPPHRSRR